MPTGLVVWEGLWRRLQTISMVVVIPPGFRDGYLEAAAAALLLRVVAPRSSGRLREGYLYEKGNCAN